MDNFRGCLKSRNMYNVPCVEREEEGEEGNGGQRSEEVREEVGDLDKKQDKRQGKHFTRGISFERLSN